MPSGSLTTMEFWVLNMVWMGLESSIFQGLGLNDLIWKQCKSLIASFILTPVPGLSSWLGNSTGFPTLHPNAASMCGIDYSALRECRSSQP